MWDPAYWTVRTLLDVEELIGTVRQGDASKQFVDRWKIDQEADELDRSNIDVIALQKMKTLWKICLKTEKSFVLVSGRLVSEAGVLRKRREDITIIPTSQVVDTRRASVSQWKPCSYKLVRGTLKVGSGRHTCASMLCTNLS